MVGSSTIYWFRKALRLHDNAALLAAMEGSSKLYPVFCLDPWFVASGRVGANRLHFLLQSLADLDCSLRSVDSRLIVLRGDPCVELPRAMSEWSVDRIVFETDTEPFARARDAKLSALAETAGVSVETRWGHTLCDLDALLKRHPGGRPTTTYGAFLGHLGKQLAAQPIQIAETPRKLPPVGPLSESDALGVPTGSDLGLSAQTGGVVLPGGETEAIKRMEAHLANTEWVAAFEKPSTSPTEMNARGERTRSTTALSPYLKFGCLSTRVLHQRVDAVYAAHPKHSKPPTSLHGQLYWREFYYAAAYGIPNYEQMEGNQICRMHRRLTPSPAMAHTCPCE